MPMLSLSTTTRLWTVVSVLLVFVIQRVSAAWQEIGDYTDCGSTGFNVQQILVSFDDAGSQYWLNISILGNFTQTVLDSNEATNLASTFPFFPFIRRIIGC
jgi:hypothetical protein